MSLSIRRTTFVLLALLVAAWLDAGCDSNDDSSTESGASESDAELDPDLIGAWRHTETYVSGDFTGVVDEYLWLNSDGSYREGGSAAAGDAGSSVVHGEDDAAQGTWRTEDRVLYAKPAGANEWFIVSAYVADGEHMLFRLAGGSNKIWERM